MLAAVCVRPSLDDVGGRFAAVPSVRHLHHRIFMVGATAALVTLLPHPPQSTPLKKELQILENILNGLVARARELSTSPTPISRFI